MTTVLQAKKARQRLFHTFKIDWTDPEGVRYIGSFTTKKLSVAETGTVGVRKAQLNGGMHFSPDHPGAGVDEDTDSFNAMIAHLDVSLQQAPDWWKLDEIIDPELIGAVYKEVMEHENSFLGRRRGPTGDGESGSSSEGSSSGDSSEAGPDGDGGAVVSGEVQDPFEP